MSNTIIQIKRSTVTNQPSGGSLTSGEQAYSYSSNVLFIGTSDNNGIIPVGGKFYVDKTNTTLDIAVAAFGAANSAGSSEQIGNIFNQANAAFDKANSANYFAFLVNANTVAAFDTVNAVATGANSYLLSVIAGANTAVGTGANAFTSATIAGANTAVGTGANTYLLSVIAGANTAVGAGANTVGSAAFDKANTAETIAIAAYANSNTKLSLTGGTISGDLSVTGNLIVTGNVVSVDTIDIVINDPLILLANNNFTDAVDIGFIAHYGNTTNVQLHTGVLRNHVNKEYYIFDSYAPHILDEGGNIDISHPSFRLSVLNADIKTSNLVLGGANTIDWITAAFDKANGVATGANSYLLSVIAGANTAVGAGANAFASATIAGANTAVGTGANTYLLSVIAGANTAVGAGANAFATAFASNAANITLGTLVVARGGTGVNTFANNGILFGNTTSGIRVTAAGTEGQVLQASNQGTPVFAGLDGGVF